MAITEITKFQTEDGEQHDTLQAAQKHQQREELIRWLMSNTDIDYIHVAGHVVDALYKKYTLVPNDES